MRVSYDWLKTMIDIPEDPKTLSDEYIRTGTEVEAIDTVGESFDHVVTAKVLTKTPHPDSDHMYVCSVDVGDKNLDADGNPAPLQIVCGAQNFEAGDHIVTAMIGAVLPGDVKIKKSKLRGVVSMGMNCSARELGLGGDHSGIMILPEDTPCGMPFAEYVGSSDTVLDCEITPNRPDCLSMIGMARETGAIFDRDFHVELPAIKVETGRATDDELSVEIADEGLCDRYVARIVRNVKVGPSPDWMVKRLNALGVRPHNNIVDITNYVMMLTGQPLHAFDLDTFAERDGHRRVVVEKGSRKPPPAHEGADLRDPPALPRDHGRLGRGRNRPPAVDCLWPHAYLRRRVAGPDVLCRALARGFHRHLHLPRHSGHLPAPQVCQEGPGSRP